MRLGWMGSCAFVTPVQQMTPLLLASALHSLGSRPGSAKHIPELIGECWFCHQLSGIWLLVADPPGSVTSLSPNIRLPWGNWWGSPLRGSHLGAPQQESQLSPPPATPPGHRAIRVPDPLRPGVLSAHGLVALSLPSWDPACPTGGKGVRRAGWLAPDSGAPCLGVNSALPLRAHVTLGSPSSLGSPKP